MGSTEEQTGGLHQPPGKGQTSPYGPENQVGAGQGGSKAVRGFKPSSPGNGKEAKGKKNSGLVYNKLSGS